MSKEKVFTTRAQEFRMNQILAEHLKRGDDGLFEYDEGWSDEAVAKIIREAFPDAEGVRNSHVASCRLAVFGAIRPARQVAANSDELAELRAAVERLSRDVDTLKAWAAQRPRGPYAPTLTQMNGVGAHV